MDQMTTDQERHFNEMVSAYSPRLLAVALYLSKNHQVAEDIVQDAFLKLWENRATISPQNLSGWLYRVVVHAAYKYLNKRSRNRRGDHFLQIARQHSYTGVEEYLIHKQGLEIFHSIYSGLPKQQQAVYRLAHQEDLNRNEIACRLKISPNTVKNHLAKATQFIKAHITNVCLALSFLAINNLFLNNTSTISSQGDLYKVNKINNKSLLLYDPQNREPLTQICQHLGHTGY